MQGAALLRLRPRLKCAGLQLCSEVAMVQKTRAAARVGTGRGSGGGSDGGGREARVAQSFAMGGGI